MTLILFMIWKCALAFCSRASLHVRLTEHVLDVVLKYCDPQTILSWEAEPVCLSVLNVYIAMLSAKTEGLIVVNLLFNN